MTQPDPAVGVGSILAINGGSSTLKFALFRIGDTPVPVLSGLIDRIGSPEGTFAWTPEGTGTVERRPLTVPNHAACVEPLMDCLKDRLTQAPLAAIGHRVVHGGRNYREPQRVTPMVMEELHRLSPYDPEHLPAEIAVLKECARRYPGFQQIVCFDTAFHRDMPAVARRLPIPRRYDKMGIQRYGFHGLSCAYVMDELQRIGFPAEANGRVIIAHLGNGASLTAVHKGRSIDTTMGFTPASGLPMSRRSGDLDPGLVSYLARTEGMTVEQFHRMVNSESGLLGVSERSFDMRDLLAYERSDPQAAEAVALFCYQAKKGLGAFAAVLGGLDTLVFTGGIGENSAIVRSRICEGLDHLGIVLDETRNGAGAAIVSVPGTDATVRVMQTDEEHEIARSVIELLHSN